MRKIERFDKYMNINKLNDNQVTVNCGLSVGLLGKARRGDSDLGDKSIEKILSFYQDINRVWLLTGEGEMLKEGVGDSSGRGSRIRYWVDVDATAGGVELFDDMTTNRFIDLSIPEFRDCTDAVNLYGDSMMPLYRNGQIIILKEWKESFIDFGNVYLVITCNGNRMVKYLRRGSDADHVLCISENKDFDPFEIERKDILRLYLVKGGISKNTL